MTASEEPPFGPEDFSGPEHYARAAHYAGRADGAFRAGDMVSAATLAAIGQVHATLAAAAAAALNDGDSGMGTYDSMAWHKVAGVKPHTPR